MPSPFPRLLSGTCRLFLHMGTKMALLSLYDAPRPILRFLR